MLLKRFKKAKKDGESGQSLAEFVLVLPIFLLLVFAIIDFGMGFHAWLTVTNSAREGARLGSVRGPATGGCDNDPSTLADNIKCRVIETADSLDSSKMTVTITNAQGDPGESVIVDVGYAYDLITPLDSFLGMISGDSIGPTLTFSSKADMRLE